ncbi:MAG: hypothetical protein IPP22_11775 [Nitrosomonas sp.]|nr:hypothetical protein [Nitrosomonas sp.]
MEITVLPIPTLGYEGVTTLSKTLVAETQLIEAISLFVANKFLCAITLAGAAEEIVGKLLLQKSELPAIRESIQSIQEIRAKTGLTVMEGNSDNKIVDEWNTARNSLKHLVLPDQEYISINLCDEAYWMIKRALANAQKLNVAIENEDDFENWVIININL